MKLLEIHRHIEAKHGRKHANPPHSPRLLRARCERPRCCRAAERG
jgi:hypothetical protein